MSANLVAQLRESVRACRALDRSVLLTAAADELERLLSVEEDLLELRKENTALRLALKHRGINPVPELRRFMPVASLRVDGDTPHGESQISES